MQLVLEFAPVMAVLVQNRKEANLATTVYQLSQPIQKAIEYIDISSEKFTSEEDFEKQKRLQQELVVYQQETQLKIANQERETTLKLPEVHKILDSWPLRLYPAQILESHTSSGRTPLKIFLAPPKVQFDEFDKGAESGISEIELMLAEGLREFLNQDYSLHCQVRPTEFLAGAWDSKRFHSESSIKALFGMLKSEPTLILESEVDGDYLNFRIAYWGLGQGNYYYKTISRLPYKEILEESAKSRALEWKKIRDELVALGENLEEINTIGRDNVINLAILEKAEKWKYQGIDISKLSFQYQVNRQDFEKLCQVLISCHCLVTSWVADAFHLVHHDVSPLLPGLLPKLLQETLNIQSVQAITTHAISTFATGYKQIYAALEKERRYWIPELSLQLAQSLSSLPDSSWAKEQVECSVNTWLQLRQVSLQEKSNPLEAMQSAVRIGDGEYIEKLREYFAAVGDRQSVTEVEKLLQAIANLKKQRQMEYAFVRHTLSEHSSKVSSVIISPDGQTLVSGSADKTIKIWNLHSGKRIRNITTGNFGEVTSLAVSPDGDFFAAGGHDSPRSNVKVWHVKTGKLLHTLLGHQKPVNFVVISPDAQILASGSNKIKIWNLHKGDRICTLWHTSSVNAAVISLDGAILASASSDKKIRLWNPHTGEPLRTLIGHSDEVKSLAINPDGQILVSGSADKSIKIWHLETGKVISTLKGHSDDVKSIAISSDGQILISGSADKSIKIWRLNTGELLHTLTGHSGAVNSVAISSDGHFFASASSDKTIKIWQVVNWQD